MKVSVIIPTYKPKDYLWDCLDSLVVQTMSKDDYEIILVLNGCSSPYKSKIEGYIKNKMKNIHVNFIYTEQCGVSNARNLALDQSKGEFITFIDDDDFVSPRYLESLYYRAGESTISMCYPLSFKDGTEDYQAFYITKDYRPSHVDVPCSWITARRYFNGPVYKLIHRNIIGDRRFDIRFTHGEDSLFMFLISDRFKWISFAPEDAIYYRRIRLGSAMMTKKNIFNRLANECRLVSVRTYIYLTNPTKYSLRYYLRSILSGIYKIVSGQ